jgi:hypothetical protein
MCVSELLPLCWVSEDGLIITFSKYVKAYSNEWVTSITWIGSFSRSISVEFLKMDESEPFPNPPISTANLCNRLLKAQWKYRVCTWNLRTHYNLILSTIHISNCWHLCNWKKTYICQIHLQYGATALYSGQSSSSSWQESTFSHKHLE